MPLKHGLPRWPQKHNQLQRALGLRRRLLADLTLLNSLAEQYQVPTNDRSALQVLSDLEWVLRQTPSSSPTFQEQKNE